MPNFRILTEEDRAALLGVPTNDEIADLVDGLEILEATIQFHEGGSCCVSAGSIEIEADSFSAAAKAMLGVRELIEAVRPTAHELDDRIILDEPGD